MKPIIMLVEVVGAAVHVGELEVDPPCGADDTIRPVHQLCKNREQELFFRA